MIYLLSLLTTISCVTSLLLFKRLQALESPRVNPLKGYDMDHLSILLEFSPLLTDVETENSLRELNEFLRYNDGILSNALDTYFQGALDDSEIKQDIYQLKADIEELQSSAVCEDDICNLIDESEVSELTKSALDNLTIKIER